jgi:hypothetical protein
MWWMVDAREAEAVRMLGWGTRDAAARLLALGEGRAGDRPGRAPTRVIALPGRDDALHLRRVVHGGALAPLWRGRLAGPGRVHNELLITADLRKRGAPVPRAVLGVALRAGGLWRASLATIHIEGAADGITFLASRPTPGEVEPAAEAAGRALRSFHDCGGWHRDLHVGNLLVRSEADGYRAWVIDLDRARAGTPPEAARRRRELRRLTHSIEKRRLEDVLGARGMAAFRSGYGCAGADRPPA